ncbi:MAG: MBL fold metallo-hydrolase [Simkania negevensis]|nr:MBL fold metallo-hydrolase [Simkania negevensis]
MLLHRFEERGLSHFSYAIGCREKGQIAIIDPRRDVEIYLDYAEKERLVISHVFETHIHADYLSGAYELARRARATLFLSGYDKGQTYQIHCPHQDCFEGDRFQIGLLSLEVLHTPGPTPEHLSFIASEDGKPRALFSGDFLLCGSVGCPDFYEEEKKEEVAKTFYFSLKEKIEKLPGELEIYPAHGAGSILNANVESVSSSSLRKQRVSNPFLRPNLMEEEFLLQLFSSSREFPSHFFKVKERNITQLFSEVKMAEPLEMSCFKKERNKGAFVLDLRSQEAFAKGHIPGSLCIGVGIKLGLWASLFVPYNTPLLLVLEDSGALKESLLSLARVGLDQVLGFLSGGFETWRRVGGAIDKIGEVIPDQLEEAFPFKRKLIDVRSKEEWDLGHLPGAIHAPLGELSAKIGTYPREEPLLFVCAGGYRSILAASLFKQARYTHVSSLIGGMLALRRYELAKL